MNSLQRIYALFLRQIYLIRKSPPRLITYVFWPTIFMLVWGFLNQYLYQDTKAQKFALSTFLGANLLLSVMERSNLNVMMGFLEDVWAKNIGNILISPIRTGELIIGVIINGFIGMTIGVSFAFLIAKVEVEGSNPFARSNFQRISRPKNTHCPTVAPLFLVQLFYQAFKKSAMKIRIGACGKFLNTKLYF